MKKTYEVTIKSKKKKGKKEARIHIFFQLYEISLKHK